MKVDNSVVLSANWDLDCLFDGKEKTFTISFIEPVSEVKAFLELASYLDDVLEMVHTLSLRKATPAPPPVES